MREGDRNKNIVGEGGQSGMRRGEGWWEGVRGCAGGLKCLTLTQIMIIVLAGSERLDTSIVYESPQS